MKDDSDVGIEVNPDAIRQMIAACDAAATKVGGVLYVLRLHGQNSQKWADDAVSHDVAGHYTLQLWSGKYCTYSALNNYYEELSATAETLRKTLTDYKGFDSTTAGSMEKL